MKASQEVGLPRLPPIRLRSLPKNLDALKENHELAQYLEALSVTNGVVSGGISPSTASSTGASIPTYSPTVDPPPAIPMGSVVVGHPVVSSVTVETSAVRRARVGVSHGLVEHDEGGKSHLSGELTGVELSGISGEGMSAFADQDWDSDTYDNEDDAGYVRQLVEDEEWFFTHEINSTSDDERTKQHRAPGDSQAKLADSASAQKANDDDVYFSGEEYYRQHGRHQYSPDQGSGGLEYGGFGGFSFPSPSSGDALSRMDSGRSMWSVGDGTPERDRGVDDIDVFVGGVGGGLDGLAADDTLAMWKQKSAASTERGDSTPDRDSGVEDSYRSHTADGGLPVQVGSDDPFASWNQQSAGTRGGGEPSLCTGEGEGNDTDVFRCDLGSAAPTEVQVNPLALWKQLSGGSADGAADAHAEESSATSGQERGDASNETGAKQRRQNCQRRGGEEASQPAADAVEESERKSTHITAGEVPIPNEPAEPVMQRPARGDSDFEIINLKVIHRKNRTGFEEEKEFPVVINSVVAGRYHVTEFLGSAAFSKAIQAHDMETGMDVCMKVIKNNKDFFDQSLDEVKLLKYINRNDPEDKHHILRLYDFFYHREHLFLVCELLRANLYEFYKYNRESGGEVYFTMPRLQSISRQCLEALRFMHSLGLIHCDLKPENILVKSYSRCEIKVIDLGSSCFETDHLCSYVQSRSYRAPEVILGLPYNQKIDIWSLGCILAELCSGQVLFQNDSLATLLARVAGILGPFDPSLLARGRETHKYFTKNHVLYERNPETEQLDYLIPKKTSLRHRLPMADSGFVDFVSFLLEVDPNKRPTASEAMQHPWLSHPYDRIST